MDVFKDRIEAGQLLAQRLASYKDKKNVLVLGIPRGGVVVAYEIAKELHAPLDVLVIKKVGFPGNEEFAIGAVSAEDHYLNEDVVHMVPKEYTNEQIRAKQEEVRRRYEALRGKKPLYSVKGKTAILVDDGIATGATMLLAVLTMKKQKPKNVVVAVPVAPPDSVAQLEEVADEVVCVEEPSYLGAVGQFYRDFGEVSEEDVRRLLVRASKRTS